METTLSQNVRKLMAAVVRVTLPINGNGRRRQLRLFTAKDAAEILDIPKEYIEGQVEEGAMQGLTIDDVCYVSTRDIAAERKEMLRQRELSRKIVHLSEDYGLYDLEYPSE